MDEAEAEAEADSDSSELVVDDDLKQIFSIPGFFLRFGIKVKPDSDAGRSPTSTLDFGVLASLGGFFSPRSPSPSSPRFVHRNKWFSEKVGLSIVSSSFGEQEFCSENIVLASQIKGNHFVGEELYSNSSSPKRSSSSPMDIILSSQGYSGPLTPHEMALSEDYTCIISHGPNPKTTHIFGDCILDCDPNELEEIENPEGDCSQDCHQIHHIHGEKGAGVEDSFESSDDDDLFHMAMTVTSAGD